MWGSRNISGLGLKIHSTPGGGNFSLLLLISKEKSQVYPELSHFRTGWSSSILSLNLISPEARHSLLLGSFIVCDLPADL